MKIALIGATGNIGLEIAQRALQRGHTVTAIVRNPANVPRELDGASLVLAPLDDARALVDVFKGQDVVASAYGVRPGTPADSVSEVVAQLIATARAADIRRLLVVGGAGSLEVSPGRQLVDTPDFPEAYKPYALAHRAALQLLRNTNDLEWTFYAPAAEIGPWPQRHLYRTQATALLSDKDGKSIISYADYASAFLDEIEEPRYLKQVATAAY